MKTAMLNFFGYSSMALLPLALAASISGAQAPSSDSAGKATGLAPSAPSAGAPTDPQIEKLVMTANEGEIEAAKLAVVRAKNSDVRSFAKMMLAEHSKNQAEQSKIAKKENIAPEISDASKSMKSDASDKIGALRKLNGADFDKAYTDLQVEMHAEVLSDLNDKLIPSATNEKLKSFLTDTKAHVQEHLARAQKLQASLINGK